MTTSQFRCARLYCFLTCIVHVAAFSSAPVAPPALSSAPVATRVPASQLSAGDGDLLVLGAGWVGSTLASRLHDQGHRVHVTNRPGSRQKVPYFQPIRLASSVPRSEFDIASQETWASLPLPSTLRAAVVTFPTTPDLIEPFWEEYLQHVPQVICYSSSSLYRVDRPGQTVNEETPLKKTPRACAELHMQERGATVLTLSGIFGDRRSARSICSCLASYTSSGGALNGKKSVNMVHVSDIITATETCLALPPKYRARRINVGGHHFLLGELVAHCKHPPIPIADDTDFSSKRVCSCELLSHLPPDFGFVQPFEGCAKPRHCSRSDSLAQPATLEVKPSASSSVLSQRMAAAKGGYPVLDGTDVYEP